MNKDKRQLLLKVGFIALVGVMLIVGASYGSGLFFFHLNKMPLDQVRPFTIWQYFSAYKSSPVKFIRFSVIGCALGPYVLAAIGLTALLLSKRQKRSLHGDARFATLQEIKEAGLINPKDGLERTILVGKYQNHYLTYGGYQFVMLAAPTRSGKGVGVVIPNCLNYSDSLVVLDIKLENFDITSGFRAKHGQEVYLFSPFDTNGRTHRYNPLSYISDKPAERIGDVDAIAAALYSSANDNDKFWSENAKDLFRGLCLMVLEHPSLPKTLGEILRQASGKGKPFKEHIQEMLQEAVDQGRPFSSACADALQRIINNSDNTLAGIVSTFNGPLLIFQNPRVDCATSANDFDLRDVRKKRMTIYLGVTPDKLKDASVLVNLFFDQLLNLNTRVLPQQDPSLKYQCLLILDEFTAIGRVNMIQQAISYQAGYNMRVLTIIQNKSQLEDKYTKAGAITLMANHALMIMYAPSPVVQSDANEYSEMLGYQTVESKSKGKSFNGGGMGGGSNSRSENTSEQKRALMLPQEIKELGRWREIVSLENCKPILCDKIKYFEDPAFMARTNLEPPKIPIQDVDRFIEQMGLGFAPSNSSQSTSQSSAPVEPENDDTACEVPLGDASPAPAEQSPETPAQEDEFASSDAAQGSEDTAVATSSPPVATQNDEIDEIDNLSTSETLSKLDEISPPKNSAVPSPDNASLIAQLEVDAMDDSLAQEQKFESSTEQNSVPAPKSGPEQELAPEPASGEKDETAPAVGLAPTFNISNDNDDNAAPVDPAAQASFNRTYINSPDDQASA